MTTFQEQTVGHFNNNSSWNTQRSNTAHKVHTSGTQRKRRTIARCLCNFVNHTMLWPPAQYTFAIIETQTAGGMHFVNGWARLVTYKPTYLREVLCRLTLRNVRIKRNDGVVNFVFKTRIYAVIESTREIIAFPRPCAMNAPWIKRFTEILHINSAQNSLKQTTLRFVSWFVHILCTQ